MPKGTASSPSSIRVIALASRQGGTGKTTTAISLAAGLARKGKNILLIDLDPQASSSSLLLPHAPQLPPKEETIYATLYMGKPLLAHPTGIASLSLVPAHLELISDKKYPARNQDSDHPEQLLICKRELDKIRQHYDFVFIDRAPVLDWLTLNGLAAADMALIPFIPSFSAATALTQMRHCWQTSARPHLSVFFRRNHHRTYAQAEGLPAVSKVCQSQLIRQITSRSWAYLN